MQHFVNVSADADLSAVIASLEAFGPVTTPFPRTPRLLLVEASAGATASLDAVGGVEVSCDCEALNDLHTVQELEEGMWALSTISDTPGTYEYDANGAGTRIYIVDTPLNPDVSELAGRAEVIHDPFNQGGGFHGTTTAVCAAGTTYGVAKQAYVYGAAGFDKDGGSGSVANLQAALDAVANHIEDNPNLGFAVVSMSWGITGTILANPYTAVMQRLRSLGAVLCCSAGNGDGTNGFDMSSFITQVWPAEDPNCVTVGAHDINNVRTPWSNYGPTVNINAPGLSVRSMREDGSVVQVSGTSFSCPYTSGAFACAGSTDIADPEQYILDTAITDGVTNVPQGSTTRLFKPAVIGETVVPPVEPPVAGPQTVLVIDEGDAFTDTPVFAIEQGNATSIYHPQHDLDEAV